jgi:hypothetical protein
MRTLGLAVLVALGTSCGNSTFQLSQTDGLKLVTGGFSGALYQTETDGKTSKRVMDTSREGHTQAIKARAGVVDLTTAIKIVQIMDRAPGVFTEEFLRQSTSQELDKILGALKEKND